jgi:hypothetical protein
MRPLMGSTSNLNFVPQGHWILISIDLWFDFYTKGTKKTKHFLLRQKGIVQRQLTSAATTETFSRQWERRKEKGIDQRRLTSAATTETFSRQLGEGEARKEPISAD